MRIALRVIAVIFAAGSAVGLVKNIVALSPHLALLATGWPFWWPALGIPIGIAFWFLSNWQAHRERIAQARPRRVPVEGRDAPKAILAPCDPQRIVVAFQARDMETEMFASDLFIAIANAGWKHCGPLPLHSAADFLGLLIEVSDDASPSEKKSARALVDWIKGHKWRLSRRTMEGRASVTLISRQIVSAPIRLTVGPR